MSITDDTLREQAKLDRALRRIDQAAARDLTVAWALAWDEVSPALHASLRELLVTPGDKITIAAMLRNRRLNRALRLIGAQLQRLARESGIRISGDVAGIIQTAGAAQASIIDTQLPPGFLDDVDSWARVDAHQIEAAVARSVEQITALHVPLADEAYDAVRREVIRGVTVGTNPRRTAARMVARARSGFNGGLSRALVIARTEAIDAYRAGAAIAQAEHLDVLAGWQWVATLTARTCPSCLAMHGSVHPLDDPGPLDHQQGRCARVPVVKPWSALGVSGVEEPPSMVPDAGAWFDGLSKIEQVGILGDVGYDAWKAGRWPMSAWAQRRRTQGWRDSYAPAKPPSSTAAAA